MPKVTKRKRLISLFERWRRFEEENIPVEKSKPSVPNAIYEYNLRRMITQEVEWRLEEDEDLEDAEEEEVGDNDEIGEWEELLEKEVLNEEEGAREGEEERYWHPEFSQDAGNEWLPFQERSNQKREAEATRKPELELEALLGILRSKRYLAKRKRIKPVVPLASWFEQERLQSE